jgi:hypothetical protein
MNKKIMNILLFFGYIPKHKIGSHVQTVDTLREEYLNVRGFVINQDRYGSTTIKIIKGNRQHRKGGRLFMASHLFEKV